MLSSPAITEVSWDPCLSSHCSLTLVIFSEWGGLGLKFLLWTRQRCSRTQGFPHMSECPALGSRAQEGERALIPASHHYLIPLVNLALGVFLRCPKMKPNYSRWIKCCKQPRTAFSWFIENVEKPWMGEQSTTTQSKKVEEWLLSTKGSHSLCELLKGQLELTWAANHPYWEHDGLWMDKINI